MVSVEFLLDFLLGSTCCRRYPFELATAPQRIEIMANSMHVTAHTFALIRIVFQFKFSTVLLLKIIQITKNVLIIIAASHLVA